MIEKLKKLEKPFIEEFTSKIDKNLNHYRKSQRSTQKNSLVPTFKEIFEDSSQPGADLTKAINPIILVIFFDIIEEFSDVIVDRREVAGLDCMLDSTPYEIKITRSTDGKKVVSWTGNKSSDKISKHILISYSLDYAVNQITHLFIGFIDLDDCVSTKWNKSNSKKAQFSNLTIKSEDAECMHIIVGSKKPRIKNTHFLLQKLVC